MQWLRKKNRLEPKKGDQEKKLIQNPKKKTLASEFSQLAHSKKSQSYAIIVVAKARQAPSQSWIQVSDEN